MKILCNEQNTDEWDRLRRGKLTASAASAILARRGTKGHDGYVLERAMDLEGVPDFAQDDPPWFRDGKQWEAWARGWYSWQTDNDVHEIGLVGHDDYDYIACSPDGYIGILADSTYDGDDCQRLQFLGNESGLCEIKFRKMLHTFHEHTAKVVGTAYNQMQMQMWVTGAPWCDYVNFWRDDRQDLEKGHIKRIQRDEARIDKIEEACLRTQREILALVLLRQSR